MEEQLGNIINKYVIQGYFPSAVCNVFNSEEILYRKSFGDVKLDTIFDVASLSKIITATEILILINEGKIDLNGKINLYLPLINKYDVLKDRLSNVTIEQLLTHNSGIVDWYPFYSEKGKFLEVLNNVLGKYEKVQKTMYSDLNFMILGEIIKNVTKLKLSEALEQYIKVPLNLNSITYCPNDKRNIAPTSFGNTIEEDMCKLRNLEYSGWRNKNQAFVGEVNDGNSYYFFNGLAGHAGIFSNVEDYVKLCQFYMSSKNKLFQASMSDYGGGRGLGWQISDVFPLGCGHSGFTGTSIWICKEKNVGAVIFSNRLYTMEKPKNLNKFREEMHKCILYNL